MFSRIGFTTAVIAGLVFFHGISRIHAQTPVSVSPAPAAAANAPAAPKPESSGLLVRVDVVVAGLQGEKKLSSLPYTLYATPGSNSSLRLGQSVPIVTSVGPASNPTTPVGKSVSYQSVGTNIDVSGFRVRSDGRYEMSLALSSSFVYAVPGGNSQQAVDQPVIGSYTVNTPVIVRDGQTLSFSTATDKVTGETMRAELTVTAVK